MVSHSVENAVLVLAPEDGLGAEAADTLAALIADLVQVHAPMPAVIVIEAGTDEAVIDAVVRAHRRCRPTGVLMSVASVKPAASCVRGRQPEAGISWCTPAPT
ncbi:hypothetical protein ACGFSG_26010 [Streptomyces sp. NPDC048512]|uniref:hypothetical protein n=1 Tax=unclassified Streptomyces TaxID=2593676 RepID=UPI0009BD518D|nr:hypothetical protein [Streptomyces sp. M41(2017)]